MQHHGQRGTRTRSQSAGHVGLRFKRDRELMQLVRNGFEPAFEAIVRDAIQFS